MPIYPAVYQDKNGLIKTQLENDFKTLRIQLNEVVFEGESQDTLAPVAHTPPAQLQAFSLAGGYLCDFSLFYQMTIPVIDIFTFESKEEEMEVKVRVGKAVPNENHVKKIDLYVALYLDDYLYRTKHSNDSFEGALRDLHQLIPEAFKVKSCFSCAFSDYSPHGNGLFGDMLCFKKDKEAYKKAYDKRDVLDLIEDDIHIVTEETFVCDEYEMREEETGYRG